MSDLTGKTKEKTGEITGAAVIASVALLATAERSGLRSKNTRRNLRP